jgi:hypothetical protein
LAYLEERPLDWLRLEARKLWLTIGNDDILQDYSIRGEQAVIPWAHRAGLPFGVLLAFGVLGLVVLWRNRAGRGDLEPAPTDHRPLVLLLSGQILAVLLACLVYFTSAQHRLPLVVPLALAAGPAVLAIHAWLRRLLARRRAAAHAAASVGGRAVAISPPPSWAVLAAGVLLAQAFVPRGEPAGTPPTYWYNVAYVQRSTGDYHGALRSVELAIRAAPGEARFLRERAEILRVMGRQNEARTATLEAERAASRDRVAPR